MNKPPIQRKARNISRLIVAACIAMLLASACATMGAVVIPICIATGDQIVPAMYDNWIVWEDYRVDPSRRINSDVYAYNLEDATERPICTTTATQWWPAIYENTIIWMDTRNTPAGADHFDIYSYDLGTGMETAAVVTNRNKWVPAIYGNRMTWDEHTNPADPEGWDIGSATMGGSVESICSAPGGQYDSSIWANKVVWQDNRNGSYDIYCYDTQTRAETQVCAAADDQWVPDICGDIVVWEDYRNRSTTKADIYMKNLSTGVETAICTAPGAQECPRVHGNLVVWTDFRTTTSQIYGYDLTTGQQVQLTAETKSCSYPRVWGNKVVFRRGGTPTADIYMTFFEPAAYETLPLNSAKARTDGTAVKISGNIVTGRFGGVFYMEDEDRHCGIRVRWPVLPALGTTMTVSGTMRTRNGERFVDACSVVAGAVAEVPKPVCMAVKWLGGAPLAESVGLSNLGMLVRTAGIVDSVGATYFYIKDGSGKDQIRAKVVCGSFTKPSPGDYVGVTGNCRTEPTATGIERAIRVRSEDDITNYSH